MAMLNPESYQLDAYGRYGVNESDSYSSGVQPGAYLQMPPTSQQYVYQPQRPAAYQAPTSTISGTSSSSSIDPINGFINAGVQTGTIITQALFTYKQMKAIEKARKEDAARYEREYANAMKQKNLDDIFRARTYDENMAFNREQFNWNKKIQRQQQAFQTMQYRDTMEERRKAVQRQEAARASGNVLALVNNNLALRQAVMARMV
jgi:hypothetical protein